MSRETLCCVLLAACFVLPVAYLVAGAFLESLGFDVPMPNGSADE
jgi:hypothetical protein